MQKLSSKERRWVVALEPSVIAATTKSSSSSVHRPRQKATRDGDMFRKWQQI